jgi:adhesin transport system membrane fusion protein
MLNISPNRMKLPARYEQLKSLNHPTLPKSLKQFSRWLSIFFIMLMLFLFMPWTQNIQSKGTVTNLLPAEKPQTIHSTIAGRIEKWYVREGQLVKAGDTILFLSEIKVDYFDPKLVERTNKQVDAKSGAIESYEKKIVALAQQIVAMENELKFKTEQLKIKVKQEERKAEAAKAEFDAEKIDLEIATKQFLRTKELYKEGIKSLTEVEDKNNKLQETTAKLNAAENKWKNAENEIGAAKLQLSTTLNEYNNKIAKAQSEKFATQSDIFDSEGAIQKMKITAANYSERNKFYYITAPKNGYVTQVIKGGIGETVKEGDPILTFFPEEFHLAVEMYIMPMDLPLLKPGSVVRFMFDGWPAFVFSGWPNSSFGTFGGKVVAVDNFISAKNQYRVLVAPDPDKEPWPTALRPGSGANCIALLNDVPVYYEIWRQINGFPPEFYKFKGTKNESIEGKNNEKK